MRQSKFRAKDLRKMILTMVVIVIVVAVAGGIAVYKGVLFAKPKVEQMADNVKQGMEDTDAIKAINSAACKPLFYGGHTYLAVERTAYGISQMQDEADAHAWCEDIGGHMLTIDSEEENYAIADYLTRIGVLDASFSNFTGSAETGYQWAADGTDMTYTNWTDNPLDIEKDGDNMWGSICVGITRAYPEEKVLYTDGIWAHMYGSYIICEWDKDLELESVNVHDLSVGNQNGTVYSMDEDDEPTDIQGNVYSSYLTIDGVDEAAYYVEYSLRGDYSVLTGVVSYDEDGHQDMGKYVNIYGDNELLFSSNTMYSDSDPQEFSVNVIGVETLRIEYPATDGENKMAALYNLTVK